MTPVREERGRVRQVLWLFIAVSADTKRNLNNNRRFSSTPEALRDMGVKSGVKPNSFDTSCTPGSTRTVNYLNVCDAGSATVMTSWHVLYIMASFLVVASGQGK